jgi:hypothetical protein
MALGLLDKQGEEVCQHYSCMSLSEPSEVTDQQYWVLLWSIVSSIFVTVWEFNLFVSDYGKFAQFADSTGMSPFHM